MKFEDQGLKFLHVTFRENPVTRENSDFNDPLFSRSQICSGQLYNRVFEVY